MEIGDDQCHDLLLLAETSVSVWESEKSADDRTLIAEKKSNFDTLSSSSSSSLTDEKNPTKVRKLTLSFGSKSGLKQTFVFGNNGNNTLWTTAPKKKRTTVGRKRPMTSLLSDYSKKKRKPRKVRRVSEAAAPAREMPAALRDAIVQNGGGEIVLVVQKQLFDTDVKRNNNRLSMPERKLRAKAEEFLRDDERPKLRNEGLEVKVVDEQSREYTLTLKLWKMGKSMVYNLISQWNSVVQNNALKEDDLVQLWAYRRRDFELGFAVVKVNDVAL